MARNVTVQVIRGVLANRPALASGEFYFATDTNQLFIGPTPTLVGPSAGSGGAQGTALVDFGAFPGVSDAKVVITGQTGILAGSIVEAWIFPADTADHKSDEHMMETLKVFAGTIVAGTGFTIYAVNDSQINEISLGWLSSGQNIDGDSGRGTRIWGKWSVAWRWS